MADDMLLEPVRYYTDTLKKMCKENAEEYYESLVIKSQIDVEENKKTVKKYNIKDAELERSRRRKNIFLSFGIILVVLAIIAIIVVENNSDLQYYKSIVEPISGFVILLSIFLFFKFSKEKKNVKKLQEEVDSLFNICKEQMNNLNSLFSYSSFLKLLSKTLPSIYLNEYTSDKFVKLMYEDALPSSPMDTMRADDMTIDSALSGLIDCKKFIFLGYTHFYWGSKTYTGTLPISWTEYTTDSQGHSVAVHRTEILVAHVQKPYPMYKKDHCALYHTLALPRLSFTRKSVGTYSMSEKQLSSFVKKQTRKFEKKEKKALKNGESWTQMADTEFESLFNAINRDNDVEFRMMFTPYCIKNYLDMFKSKDSLGDSFTIIKKGTVNLCDLDASLNKTARPQAYEVISHSVDLSKVLFISRMESFFREIFFTLAPFFMIPVYSHSLDVKKENYTSNIYDLFDAESISSSFSDNIFRPSGTVTDIIRKTSLVSYSNYGCLYKVTSYSFYTISRVEFVPVYGQDGRMHNVPVHWDEYIQKERQKDMFLHYVGVEDNQGYIYAKKLENHGYKAVYKDGFLGIVGINNDNIDHKELIKILSSLFDKNENISSGDEYIKQIFSRLTRRGI